MNKRKRSIIILAISIVLLGSVSIVLASNGVFQQDVENVPKLPDSGVENDLNLDRPKGCVPLPQRAEVMVGGTRTPTPARDEAGTAKIVFVSPTAYPYSNIIDLYPEEKGNNKFKVVIFTCDGKTNLYYGINEDDFDFIKEQMKYGDVILDMESSARLMQREVPEPNLPETEKTQIEVKTNTPASYPPPSSSTSKTTPAVPAYP